MYQKNNIAPRLFFVYAAHGSVEKKGVKWHSEIFRNRDKVLLTASFKASDARAVSLLQCHGWSWAAASRSAAVSASEEWPDAAGRRHESTSLGTRQCSTAAALFGDGRTWGSAAGSKWNGPSVRAPLPPWLGFAGICPGATHCTCTPVESLEW